MLFDFHEFFDGILGLDDLRDMKMSINLSKKTLTNNTTSIPFHYRQPKETDFKISINSFEILKTKIPVNCEDGEIIVQERNFSKLHIPETLTYAKNGFALVEIQNRTNHRIDYTFLKPLDVINFTGKIKKTLKYTIANKLYPKFKKTINYQK